MCLMSVWACNYGYSSLLLHFVGSFLNSEMKLLNSAAIFFEIFNITKERHRGTWLTNFLTNRHILGIMIELTIPNALLITIPPSSLNPFFPIDRYWINWLLYEIKQSYIGTKTLVKYS